MKRPSQVHPTVVVEVGQHDFVVLLLGDFINAHVERLGDRHLVLHFILAAGGLIFGAAHHEAPGGNPRHLQIKLGNGPLFGL